MEKVSTVIVGRRLKTVSKIILKGKGLTQEEEERLVKEVRKINRKRKKSLKKPVKYTIKYDRKTYCSREIG